MGWAGWYGVRVRWGVHALTAWEWCLCRCLMLLRAGVALASKH